MKEKLSIASVEAEPGTKAKGYLQVGELAGGLKVNSPILAINGKDDGPVLWVTATMQGNEIHGIEICKRLYQTIEPSNVRGALVFSPISNVPAFALRSYLSPIDQVNMPFQCFPGSTDIWGAGSTISFQIAERIFSSIRQTADFVVDLHSTFLPLSEPHVVYSQGNERRDKASEMARHMAFAFGSRFVLRGSTNPGTYEANPGALLAVTASLGIPAIIVEVGGGGPRLNDNEVELGVRGMKNIMKFLKLLDGEPTKLEERQIHVLEVKSIGVNRAGFVKVEAHIGKLYHKGEDLARITNELFEEVQVVKAKEDCIPIELREDPVVHSGDRILYVATRWEGERDTTC